MAAAAAAATANGGGGGDGDGGAMVLECLTAACKALSLANVKGKGTNGLVIGSLD
jgi:hypothetical protein